MNNWLDDVRQQLAELHELVTSPVASDVPLYIRESLSTRIEELMSSSIDTKSVHEMVRGAYRAIYDVVAPDEDDAVIKQLQRIDDSLPSEQ
jgi:hypothetical protein